MKHCIKGGVAALLMAWAAAISAAISVAISSAISVAVSVALLLAGAMIAAAPPAAAGCQYGGPVISKCDGPIQPDGTWQRCVVSKNLVLNGASSFLVPERRCDTVGPGQPFADPPTRIDD